MSAEFTFDWQGAGYDAFSDLEPATSAPSGSFQSGWELIRATVSQARRGRFGLVSRVVNEIIGRTTDFELHSVACSVVADTGTAAELESLALIIDETNYFDHRHDIVKALAARGRLVDIPILFRFYERYRHHPDTSVMPLLLNSLLARADGDYLSEPAEEEWQEYRAAIAERYFRLWNELGTNLIHVYHGRAFALDILIDEMRSDLRKGFLDADDRRLFEVTTGLSCNKWFRNDEVNLLTVTADLERFHETDKAYVYPAGQRVFMGHALEDVGAAARVFAAYPSNHGLEVPEIRTAFDRDEYFALPYGFQPMDGGYFIRSTKPPPSAELTIDRNWPWLSLHTCLRAAISGNRTPLARLSELINEDNDPGFRGAIIDLIADAADDYVIEQWREKIRKTKDHHLVFSLCWGLLRRGMLLDVPLVLEAYEKNSKDRKFSYLQSRLNCLFSLQPVENKPYKKTGFKSCYANVMAQYHALHLKLGRVDVPILRGELFSVTVLARKIAALEPGTSLAADLRERFEASTGISCSGWETADGLDPQSAAASARQFLDSPESAAYRAGQLYFFGRPIQ